MSPASARATGSTLIHLFGSPPFTFRNTLVHTIPIVVVPPLWDGDKTESLHISCSSGGSTAAQWIPHIGIRPTLLHISIDHHSATRLEHWQLCSFLYKYIHHQFTFSLIWNLYSLQYIQLLFLNYLPNKVWQIPTCVIFGKGRAMSTVASWPVCYCWKETVPQMYTYVSVLSKMTWTSQTNRERLLPVTMWVARNHIHHTLCGWCEAC